MISHALQAEILRLHHSEGWPIGTIARQLRVHHETVRRVLTQAGVPAPKALRASMGRGSRAGPAGRAALVQRPRARCGCDPRWSPTAASSPRRSSATRGCAPRACTRWCARAAIRAGRIYSIPHEHVSRTLLVLATLDTVRILDGTKLIATHPRSFDRGAQIELPDHVEALVAHKRAARAHRAQDRLHHAAPSAQAQHDAELQLR